MNARCIRHVFVHDSMNSPRRFLERNVELCSDAVVNYAPRSVEIELHPVSYTHLDVYKRQAKNSAGTITQNFTLTVDQAPAITSGASTTFTVGTAGSFNVTASGFPKPGITESGSLPSGVTFNNSTDVLSGTPASGTTGTYPVMFTASNGVGSNPTQSFTLTVNAGSRCV